ncbi:hypothetical protein [Legionella drancourtii]|uniref:Transmembrane protein n=1 Tax=Legionella drancourtii LLAP12 TaxID=658187 RepID=G9ETN8_9GAMM|nr:hypothetical protein [Legionella drancourtii]EHL29239.1 hypothetical protein LDG_8673 [Legionella drancourtii LLAP12]
MALNFKKILIGTVGLSLAASAAVGLTLFLWPAALAAVAGFSVYGLSIAGIVGANTLLQIGVTAGLAFAATSVATSFAAAFLKTASWIIDACFKSKSGPRDPHREARLEDTDGNGVNMMIQLGGASVTAQTKKAEEPTHSTLFAPKASNDSSVEPKATSTYTI